MAEQQKNLLKEMLEADFGEDEQKLKEVFEVLQGLDNLQWKWIRGAVDDYFRKKASEQELHLPIGSPKELLRSYRYHTL